MLEKDDRPRRLGILSIRVDTLPKGRREQSGLEVWVLTVVKRRCKMGFRVAVIYCPASKGTNYSIGFDVLLSPARQLCLD